MNCAARSKGRQIVAAAISRVRRKNKFPPSISEVLDECSEMTKAATSTRQVITKMIALRDNAEDALIATGDLPEYQHPSDREGDTPAIPIFDLAKLAKAPIGAPCW
jgi:hypothetical protein